MRLSARTMRHALALLLLVALSYRSSCLASGPRGQSGALFYPLWAGFSSSSSTWQLSNTRVNEQQLVRFVWLLPQTQPDALRERFEAVSDPTSSQYMQYMTAEQIRQQISPPASLLQAVLNYLTQHGVDTASAVVNYGDSLAVRATVSQVQAMFATTMRWYRSSAVNSTQFVLRATAGVTVPAHLAASTRLLLNLVNPPMTNRLTAVSPAGDEEVRLRLAQQQRNTSVGHVKSALTTAGHKFHSMGLTAAAANYSGLSCYLYQNRGDLFATSADFVHARYNISSRQASTGFDGVRVAIFGGVIEDDDVDTIPLHDCYDTVDLVNIGAAYGYQQEPITGTAPYARVNDLLFEQQQLASVENSLDSQSVYLTSPTSSISLLPSADDETFYDYFVRVLNMLPSQRPHVLSLSFTQETDSDASLGTAFVEATDSVIMQLGLVGVTVIASSGDNGASGANSACTNPPPAQFGVTDTSLLPEYPASSPYVLTVGATDFNYGFGSAKSLLPYFTAKYNGTGSTPPFCGVCSDEPSTTFHCQSSYIAEQAVSVNTSVNTANAGSAHHTHSASTSAGRASSSAVSVLRPARQSSRLPVFLSHSRVRASLSYRM